MPTSGPSDSIFKHLGWEAIAGMTWQPAVVADAADLEAYAKAYGMPKPMPECPDHFSARMVQGRARINDDVAACEDVSSDAAPPYFVCGRPQ
jgi:hypothetical protein